MKNVCAFALVGLVLLVAYVPEIFYVLLLLLMCAAGLYGIKAAVMGE